MSEYGELGICALDVQGMGWTCVYHRNEAVYVSGYGESVGLRYPEAMKLLRWLQLHQAFLEDRANNYYECHECGYLHHKSVHACPVLLSVDNGKP
jgi:hypothetical protein